jgi:hypothetical protein
MTLAIETKLSSAELTQLAGTLAKRPMSRASDREAAIIRLTKMMSLHFGPEFPDDERLEIFGADSLEMAEKRLRSAMAKYSTLSEDQMAKPLKANADSKKVHIQRIKDKPAKVEKAQKEPSEKKRGRESALAGKVLTAVKDENHRREGTGGYKTFAIILKHPGITVEDCITKGGRMVDIRWDLDRKHLTAK